jgi:hypothetical protein
MLMVFNADGSAEFTRNPTLLEIAPAGHLQVERMTEIFFNEVKQLWYIKFHTGDFADHYLNWVTHEPCPPKEYEFFLLWSEFWMDHSPGVIWDHVVRPKKTAGTNEDDRLVYFTTYEGAVAIEIAFVDMLRERGFSMV